MTRTDADRLAAELSREYRGRVEVDEVASGRFRFEVFSRHFGPASHLERHDRGWAVVDRVLDREQVLDVSALLMYGPEDVDTAVAAAIP